MSFILGIRKEDKNEWERRVPLVPEHVKELKEKHDIETIVQTAPIRAYTKEEYESIGAKVQNDLSSCPIVFAVKEIPKELFEENKTYVFFSHVIKGQKYNMPMLKEMMNLKCNLIDYEKIADDKGRRLVFFGRYAGLAGMIDSLWTFGQRMEWKEIGTPFRKIKQALKYKSLEEAKGEIKKVGEEIKNYGLSDLVVPLVVGFAGYGNVSKGAQEILDCLPVKEISPKELEAIYEKPSNKVVYKVVFKEKDIVEPIFAEKEFELQDYYNNPGVYRSIFQRYVPRLSILMNCIYWDKRYPRLITKEFLEENFTGQIHLQVVGDIGIDVNGAIEFTEKATNPGNPVFIYNPIRDNTIDGFEGSGVAVLAVDTLPCELPRESSEAFGDSLMPFVEAIIKADYTVSFEKLDLPPEIKKAVILYRGKLTPDYEYMNKFL